MSLAALTAWWFTYLIHSSLLGLFALGVCRWWGRPAARVVLLRGALLGGLVTATLVGAVGSGVEVALPRASSFEGGPAAASESAALLGESADAHDLSVAAAAPAVQAASPGRPWLISGLPLLLLAASIVGLARLALRERRARRALRGNAEWTPDEWPAAVRTLLQGGRVQLELAPHAATPMALGRSTIVVPTRASEELRDDELEALVAHELAHLERRDPLWLGAARVVAAATWFQPFNALLLRRLSADTELAADARAVERTNNPLALARCLERVGSWLVPGSAPLTAATMASGSLLRRTEALIAACPNRRGGGRAAFAATASAIALLACAGPNISEGDAQAMPSGVGADQPSDGSGYRPVVNIFQGLSSEDFPYPPGEFERGAHLRAILCIGSNGQPSSIYGSSMSISGTQLRGSLAALANIKHKRSGAALDLIDRYDWLQLRTHPNAPATAIVEVLEHCLAVEPAIWRFELADENGEQSCDVRLLSPGESRADPKVALRLSPATKAVASGSVTAPLLITQLQECFAASVPHRLAIFVDDGVPAHELLVAVRFLVDGGCELDFARSSSAQVPAAATLHHVTTGQIEK